LEYRVFPRDAAVEKLEDYLIASELPAHSKLPSERSLCEKWGLNRTTLRYAINMMVEQGLLYNVKGKGTFVSPPKLARNLDGINSFTQQIRRQGIPLTTRIMNLRVVEATKQISRSLQVPLGEKVYELVLLRIVRSVPCALETLYIACSRCPGLETHLTEPFSISSIYTDIYGFVLTSGEEKISVTYVSEDEGQILGVPEGTAVFFTSGIARVADGSVAEYSKSLFRADCFRFVSEINKNEWEGKL